MVRRIVGATLLVVASAWAQIPPGATLPAQRIWVTPLRDEPGGQAAIRVRYTNEFAQPALITFECEIVAPEPMDEVHFVLTVHDSAGQPKHTGELKLHLPKGSAPAQFTWDASQITDGNYTADFTLHRRTGGHLAGHSVSVRAITGTRVLDALNVVEQRTTSLRAAFNAVASEAAPAYPALHLAILEDFLPAARRAFDRGDWRKADDFASYLDALATTAHNELSLITPAGESRRAAPGPLPPVEIARGGFRIVMGTEPPVRVPAFFFGAAHQDNCRELLPLLHRYGLNLAVYRVPPTRTLTAAGGAESLSELRALLDDAEHYGVRTVLQLAAQEAPAWLVDAAPPEAEIQAATFPYNVYAAAAREALTRHVSTVGEISRGEPSLLSFSLAENPRLRLPSPLVREGLIAVAQSRYRDHDLMNRDWKTRYMSFDEIQVNWDSRHRAYQYDLQTHHQELVTRFLSWLATTSREYAPQVPVQFQLSDTAFEKGETSYGVDREPLLLSTDINGCATVQRLNGAALSMGPPDQAVYYTLLRSLRNAPVMNTADGFVASPGIIGEDGFRRVRTMMWQAAMGGLNASAIRMGSIGEDSPDGAIPVLSRPEYIDGYATAHLDIQRLSTIVSAFQQSPAPVRILWSMSSKIFEGGETYLESARRAYQGCANFGAHVQFISERQIEREGLGDVEVLVLPLLPALSTDAFRAVEAYVQAGGVVIRQGLPAPYTEHGLGRADTLTVSKRTIYILGEDTPRAYLDALDAAFDLEGVRAVPRPVNEFGYSLDGLISRFVVHERVPYMYMVNLRDEPVTAKLVGSYSAGLDLISGNRVRFPDVIDSLTPMLIQLDEPPAERVAEAGPAFTGPPTAALTPVLSEEEAAKAAAAASPKYPPLRHGR